MTTPQTPPPQQQQQIDLFLESILDAPVKDDRALMEFPFFSLQKNPRFDAMVYDDGAVRVSVEAGPRGIATIYDKDVLIYCASLVNDRLERGAPIDRTLYFQAYDFLRLTGRSTSKRGYELLLDALDRLQSTTVRTSITSGTAGERERRGFSWLDSFRVCERKTATGSRMAAIEVTLNKWMWRALVQDRRVLSIDRDYFSLTMGLERRLYELARKHCGHQDRWIISMDKLQMKAGSTQALKHFKADLKRIAQRDSLPSYSMQLAFDPSDGPARTRAARLDASLGGHTALRYGRSKAILVVFTRRGPLAVSYQA